MALPKDLLDQAVQLLSHEPKKPKQASLRRAVSTAYYALFHLLVSEAAGRMAPNAPRNLELQMHRAFKHDAMATVCKSFAGGNLPPFISHLQSGPIETELRLVAKAFVDLQEKRHLADYDLIYTFTKQEAADEIARARDAFSAWATVSKSLNANIFLVSLGLPRIGKWRD